MIYISITLTALPITEFFKIARPDSSHNFMDTAKTIDLTRLCIKITNTIVFPIIHTSNLSRNPKQKTSQQ